MGTESIHHGQFGYDFLVVRCRVAQSKIVGASAVDIGIDDLLIFLCRICWLRLSLCDIDCIDVLHVNRLEIVVFFARRDEELLALFNIPIPKE